MLYKSSIKSTGFVAVIVLAALASVSRADEPAAVPSSHDQGNAFALLMQTPPAGSSASDEAAIKTTPAAEPAVAAPAEGGSGGKSAEDLAKMTQNPVANLISVPFQNNFNFGIGPNDATQWVLNIQPVVPITLNEEWNMITRTILPVINQQSPESGISSEFGIGDLNPTVFFSPAKSGKLIWGVGPTMTIPTGTDPSLTSGKWSAGPAAVVLTMQGHWVVGCLANQQWSFAGWGSESVNATLIQPFINYNLPHGWYLSTGPIITANWSADESDDTWLVPLGGGAGKIVKFGKLPVNLSAEAYANVVKPDGGPDWQLRLQIQFLFPK